MVSSSWKTHAAKKVVINMLDLLTAPLQYAFMVRALGAAVIVGIVCAVVGTYIVLRGMAFFGDALAHAILPGVAIGYLVSGGRGIFYFGGRFWLRW